MFWINSKSVRVIEAKLLVYRKHEEIIKSRNILIHHAFENLDEIRRTIIVHKLSSLNDIILRSDFNFFEPLLKVNIEAAVLRGSIETKNKLEQKFAENFSFFLHQCFI